MRCNVLHSSRHSSDGFPVLGNGRKSTRGNPALAFRRINAVLRLVGLPGPQHLVEVLGRRTHILTNQQSLTKGRPNYGHMRLRVENRRGALVQVEYIRVLIPGPRAELPSVECLLQPLFCFSALAFCFTLRSHVLEKDRDAFRGGEHPNLRPHLQWRVVFGELDPLAFLHSAPVLFVKRAFHIIRKQFPKISTDQVPGRVPQFRWHSG